LRIALILLPLVICLATISLRLSSVAWDDEFIFLRYALNILNGQGFTYNPGSAPTNGVTSLAQLFLGNVPLGYLSGENAQYLTPWPGMLFSLICMVVLIYALRRYFSKAYPDWLLTLVATLAISSLIYAYSRHAVNGMDTSIACLGSLVICLSITSLIRNDELKLWANHWSWLFLFLTYFFRPELMLTVAVVSALTLFTKLTSKKLVLCIGLAALAGFVSILLASQVYFGEAFPLSFYAKTKSIYGIEVEKKYENLAYLYSKQYLKFLIPLLILFLSTSYQRKAEHWREFVLANIFVLAGFIHVGFTHFMVLPIMGYNSRFMQPAFGPFVVACLLYTRCIRLPRILQNLTLHKAPQILKHIVSGATLVIIFLLAWQSILAASERVQQFRIKFVPNYWPCIERISKLEHPKKIGSTEIGYLGILFPDSMILDFAGLISPEAVQYDFDIEAMIQKHQPELIYLPHPDYKPMHARLQASQFFTDNYTIYQNKQLKTGLGIAILKSWHQHDAVNELIQGFIADRSSCGASPVK
jgi:hypothetical protein